MLLSLVLLFTLIYLMPSSPSAQNQYVEVAFTCPGSTTTVDINWDNVIPAHYSGTDGKSGTIDLKLTNASNKVAIKFRGVTHLGGQKIECRYGTNPPDVNAYYVYSISREVISCVKGGIAQQIRCRVKP